MWLTLRTIVQRFRARTQIAYLAASITLLYGLMGYFFPRAIAFFAGYNAILLNSNRELAMVADYEIRAVYGGVFTTLGIAMLWAIPMRPRFSSWLRLSSFIWLGMALTRLSNLTTPLTFFQNFAGFLICLTMGSLLWIGSMDSPTKPLNDPTAPKVPTPPPPPPPIK